MVLPLNRDGTAVCRNGRPRPPTTRSIDLRVGEDVVVEGRWRRVLGIKAYREAWVTPEHVETISDGYLLRIAPRFTQHSSDGDDLSAR